jgi:hypothetical protein
VVLTSYLSLFYTTRRVTIKANSVPMFHDHGTKSVPVRCISEWNIFRDRDRGVCWLNAVIK